MSSRGAPPRSRLRARMADDEKEERGDALSRRAAGRGSAAIRAPLRVRPEPADRADARGPAYCSIIRSSALREKLQTEVSVTASISTSRFIGERAAQEIGRILQADDLLAAVGHQLHQLHRARQDHGEGLARGALLGERIARLHLVAVSDALQPLQLLGREGAADALMAGGAFAAQGGGFRLVHHFEDMADPMFVLCDIYGVNIWYAPPFH